MGADFRRNLLVFYSRLSASIGGHKQPWGPRQSADVTSAAVHRKAAISGAVQSSAKVANRRFRSAACGSSIPFSRRSTVRGDPTQVTITCEPSASLSGSGPTRPFRCDRCLRRISPQTHYPVGAEAAGRQCFMAADERRWAQILRKKLLVFYRRPSAAKGNRHADGPD